MTDDEFSVQLPSGAPPWRRVCILVPAAPAAADTGREGPIMGKKFFFVVAALVPIVSTASAQTRLFEGEVTSGALVIERTIALENAGMFDLAGTSFHLVGAASETGGVALGRCNADPGCKPGLVIDLSAILFLVSEEGARAVVNGETLDPAFVVGSTAMQIQTGTVTIPKGNRKRLVLSAPFTIVAPGGQVDVYRTRSEWFIGAVEPWARGMITGGGGTATAFFERIHVKDKDIRFYYELRRVIYSFSAPPTVQ
jgi:hypothetical protein